MKKTLIASASLFALPFIASAQTYLTNVVGIINTIKTIVNMLIPIAIAITVLAFFYGLFQYVKGSAKGHKVGKNIMIAGIVALFIEVSLWGVIGFFQQALLNGQTAQVNVPQL